MMEFWPALLFSCLTSACIYGWLRLKAVMNTMDLMWSLIGELRSELERPDERLAK